MSTPQHQAPPPRNLGYGSAPATTNALAIAALVLSFFIGVTGVILGHIALHQIKVAGAGGRGLAIAALVIGYASTAIIAYLTIGLVSAKG